MARHDRFGDRRHAHQVGPNRAQVANLGGCLVARPGQRGVNALVQLDAVLAAGFDGDLPVGARVGLGHVGEARAEALIVGTAERVGALQVEVIADEDQRALAVLRVDAAGGVGQQQRPHSQASKNANRERRLLRRVAFVLMHTALHDRDRHLAEFANDQPAGVADGGRAREKRNLLVNDRDRGLQVAGEISQAGAEHDGNARNSQGRVLRQCGQNELRRVFGAGELIGFG